MPIYPPSTAAQNIEASTPQEAAITIQKHWRGYTKRQLFQLPQLPKEQQTNYHTMVKGNDPVAKIHAHPKKEPIALIGISGLRAVEIAADLSDAFVKIIIVDNSKYVCSFWRTIRELASHHKDAGIFIEETCKRAYDSEKDSPYLKAQQDDTREYIEYLCEKYGFERIKRMIAGATILCASWDNSVTLKNIKHILKHIEINTVYMYPSNLASYVIADSVDKEMALRILDNINQLTPYTVFHSNYSSVHRKPTKFFSFDQHSHNTQIVTELLEFDKIEQETRALREEARQLQEAYDRDLRENAAMLLMQFNSFSRAHRTSPNEPCTQKHTKLATS